MPIYEFYCSSCHMLFNFFSPRIDTETSPLCPRCEEQRLERRPALFATLKRSGEPDAEEDNPFPGLDEARLESALESLGSEMEGFEDGEDPRQMARFFRRFGDVAGLKLGSKMEEMLRRLEAGEDPDALEEEVGDGLDDEEGLEEWIQLEGAIKQRRARRPKTDDTLYFL